MAKLIDIVRPWDSLSEDEKKLFTRMAEVYAGYVSYNDFQVGRILDYIARVRAAGKHNCRCCFG